MKNKECVLYFRFLKVLEIIYENADVDNPISTNKIKDILSNSYNLQIDTRTIEKIIDIFNNTMNNQEIIKIRKSCLEYYFQPNNLGFGEAKAITDMIFCSKFFSENNKLRFLKIIKEYFNEKDGKKLERKLPIHIIGNENDESFFEAFEKIPEAIDQQRKISFKYSKPQPGTIIPTTTRKIDLWPIETYYDNNTFYIYCYDEAVNMIKNYRIDFIKEISIGNKYTLTEKLIEETRDKIINSTNGYSSKRFADIELTFKKDSYANLIDKFGKNIGSTRYVDDDHYAIWIYHCPISTTFYGWIIGFGGSIQITNPDCEVHNFKDFLQENFINK